MILLLGIMEEQQKYLLELLELMQEIVNFLEHKKQDYTKLQMLELLGPK